MNDTVDKALADALNTQVASTGSFLLPDKITEGVRTFVETSSQVYANTRKRDYDTKVYQYRKVTALPTAEAKTEGLIAAETHGTYGKDTMEMKYITTTGRVTNPEIDFSRGTGGVDAWAQEIQVHSWALLREIERETVVGDASNAAAEFSGFQKQITIAVNGGGVALSLAMLDEAIDKPTQTPSKFILGKAHSRRIWAILQAQQRFNDKVKVNGGFTVPTYQDLPILRVDDQIATALGNNILLPDDDNSYYIIGREPTFGVLAQTDDSVPFYIRAYMALVVEGANMFHSKITNVLPAPVVGP